MKCYTNPYEGSQGYIFFSYCHDDASAVYPIIERLSIEGFRVWYDNGIHPGDDWPEVIATHLSKAKVCIATISEASAESHNCRNEVSFAVANNKPFVSIVIEDFQMPLGMQLQLSSSNYIKKTDFSDEKFYQKLFSAPVIAECRNAGDSASPTAIREWQSHVQEYERQPSSSQKVSQGFIIDPTWFEERERLEAEIAALKKEQEEAEKRLKQEKERLLAEKEKRRLEEEQLQRERVKTEQERLARETEAKRQAEEEARRRAEQERIAKEAEAKRLAEEETRRRAEQERLAREAEAKRQAEEEARRRAEQERLARETEAKRQAEEEARHRAEQERLAKEAEAKRQAEEEARRRAEQERLAKEAEANEKVNLKKDKPNGESGEPSAQSTCEAILIRMRTGEIFKISKDIVRIGRDKDSDIVFSGNRAISHSQFEIESAGQTYTLKNLSSSITEINGTSLQMGEVATLSEYTEIIISDEQCFFVYGSIYRRIFEERMLKMLRCKETGETRLFVDDVLQLNRYHKWKNNILGDQRISREHHAEMFRSGPKTMLRDVGSSHGTFLNAKRLNTGEEATLHNGDIIAIVETEFIYYESSIG